MPSYDDSITVNEQVGAVLALYSAPSVFDGTIDLTYGSPFVDGVDTFWDNFEITAGDRIAVKDTMEWYQIKVVWNENLLELTSPYWGDSSNGMSYVVSKSKTLYRGYNRIIVNDIGWQTIFNLTALKIDGEMEELIRKLIEEVNIKQIADAVTVVDTARLMTSFIVSASDSVNVGSNLDSNDLFVGYLKRDSISVGESVTATVT